VLVDAYPQLVYVALRGLGLTELRTRQQIQAALRGVMDHQWFLVVDFEGVHSISEAAARELFLGVPQNWGMGMLIEAINMEPRVARAIGHVVRFGC
jgi:anti-anti-sigma regulatory factor